MKKVIIPLLLLLFLIPCSVFAYGNDGSVAYSDISPKLSSYPYYIVTRLTQYNSDGSLNNINIRTYYFSSKPTFTLGSASSTFVGASYLGYSGSMYFIEKQYTKTAGWSTFNDKTTTGIDTFGNGLYNVAYSDAKFSGTTNVWLKYELVGTNFDIKTSSNTYVTSKPIIPLGSLTYVSDGAMIDNGSILFRFSANIPYVLSQDITSIQYSFDNVNFKSLFNSSGNMDSSVFPSQTLQFYNNESMFKGEFTVHMPVKMAQVNDCKIYIKTVDGQLLSAGKTVDLINHGSDNLPGSGSNIGKAPDRSNYQDGFLGTIEWGFDTLVYYITYPFKVIASAFQYLFDNILSGFEWVHNFSLFAQDVLSFFPAPITALLLMCLTSTVIVFILRLRK